MADNVIDLLRAELAVLEERMELDRQRHLQLTVWLRVGVAYNMDPVDVIVMEMDRRKMSKQQRIELFGSRSSWYSLVHRLKGISKSQMKLIHENLGIPYSVLFIEYPLATSVTKRGEDLDPAYRTID